MAKVRTVIAPDEQASSGFSPNGEYSFKCPGCGDHHVIPTITKLDNGAIWSFNGNVNAPTFSPSLLVRSGHYAPYKKESDACWCTYDQEHPEEPSGFSCYICHSFVTDGKIQFLGDCTHHLKGQTVELPEIEEICL